MKKKTPKMRSSRSFLGSVSRKLLMVCVVGALWFCVSMFTSAMLTTSVVSQTGADAILETLKANDSDTLWALIIPTAFFLVIGTRPKNRR